MQHVFSYESDPYLRELTTEVRETGVEGDRPFAVLADTILYPEGGGQPADHGFIGEIAVLDVQRRETVIRHYLERPVKPGPASLRVDWHRRFDHMQQHTAQHLLSAVADDRFNWPTTAFHLGAELCDIELAVADLPGGELELLEEAVAAEIRAARPVTSRRVPPDHLARLAVRTRGLPAGLVGDVRLVEIEGVDLNTCGGTHVRSTAEIEALKLLGAEPMRGGSRLHFVAGGRLRRRLAAHEARNATMRALLGAPDHELAAVAQAKLGQLQATERRLRATEEELAGALAELLAARPGAIAEAHFDGRDAGFLQRLARQLVASAPDKAVLLTASSGEQGLFVLAASEALAIDVQALGREIAALLEGRGGGSGRLFQGKAGLLAARPQALARLADALRQS
ncbi:MAG: alanyl-tRNA editing protein [Thermoanaerobaculales bacterium]